LYFWCQGRVDRRNRARHPQERLPHRHDHLRDRRVHGYLGHGLGGGAETFAAGDRLAIINQNPADATLADLSITFLGKRT
jgi:hypothetical protein